MGFGAILLLGAGGFLAAVGLAVAGYFIAIRRSTPAVIVGGLMIFAGGGAALLIAAFFIFSLFQTTSGGPSNDPKRFRAEFGFEPGPDVRDLQSWSNGSNDSATSLLRFRCSPATLARLVEGRFHPAPVVECGRPRRNAPAWWQPVHSARTDCYAARPFDDAFASNAAWITYDRSSQTLHFSYEGVD